MEEKHEVGSAIVWEAASARGSGADGPVGLRAGRRLRPGGADGHGARQRAQAGLGGCANEQFSTQSCDKYSFRVFPAGRQLFDPLVAYEVKNFGDKWAIIYPDYVLGQSNLASISAALQRNGTDFSIKIAVPLGEANV